MITELVLDALYALAGFCVGLLPTSGPPDWISEGRGYLDTIWTAGAGLGAWIPWALVGTVFAAVMACIVVGFTIKVGRIVASFVTAGGGSAG